MMKIGRKVVISISRKKTLYTEKYDDLDNPRLSTASAKQKYHNTVKKLAALQENHNQQKRKLTTAEKAIEKLHHRKDDWKNIQNSPDIKINTI